MPKTLEKIEHNYKKFLCKTMKVNNVSKPYPSLEFNYPDTILRKRMVFLRFDGGHATILYL